MVYPRQQEQIDYSIRATYYRADGSVFATQDFDTHVEKGWTRSSPHRSRGWREPGKWGLGAYRVDLSVDDDLIASAEFQVVEGPALGSGPFLDIRSTLPWAEGTPTLSEQADLIALAGLMESAPALASQAAALPWVQQGPREENRGALQHLSIMGRLSPPLARQMLERVWLADGISEDERLVIKTLTLLAREDISVAEQVVDLNWLGDEISEDERWAVRWLRDIGRQNPGRLAIILGLQWLNGPFSEDIKWTILNTRDIARENAGLADELLDSAWLQDELTGEERITLAYLSDILQEDKPLAQTLAGLQWFQDGPIQREAWAIGDLRDIAREDVSLARQVLALPWLHDEITQDERSITYDLKELAASDRSSATSVLNLMWLQDDITASERRTLRELRGVVKRDASLGRLLIDSPFLQSDVTSRTIEAIKSLGFLEKRYPKVYADLTGQGWFADGITSDDAALILVFGHSSQYFDPDRLQHLLADHRVESKTIVFPLGAEIASTSIQSTQERARQDIVSLVEESAQEIELFMDIPFPMDDLILLFAGCEGLAYSEDCNFRGLHAGNHIVVDPRLAIKDARGTLIHEVAHYYLNSRSHVPLWFYEGGADFLEAYVEIQLYGETLESRKRWVDQRNIPFCRVKGINSIQRLIEKLAADGYQKHRESEVSWCNYAYGEALFLHLYETIGESAFRTAWKDIYHSGATSGSNLAEQEIYQKFLEHTPEERLQEFKEVYKRWHGGQFVK